MINRYVRIKSFSPDDPGEASDAKELKVRFIRNLKYCDLFARNTDELKEWLKHLSRFMIRMDFHERFKIRKMIGEGSFAKVYLGKQKEDGKDYAVKAFSKDYILSQPKGRESMKNEINILLDLAHRNVIELFEVHESKNSLYVILEYLGGGSLSDFLKRSTDFLSDETILNIIKYS